MKRPPNLIAVKLWMLATALGACSACSFPSGRVTADVAKSLSMPREPSAQVTFKSADGATSLRGEITFPPGAGPFPAVVVMRARMCDGLAGIPEGWQQTTLNSWGYATLTIDNFAARNLTPAACSDFTVLEPSQTIGDAYGALEVLASNPKIEARRIALLGFGGEGTTALLSDTIEARQHYKSSGGIGFRAFFAFYPYCNFEFVRPAVAYAPLRIFAGERDDISPAIRCVDLAKQLQEQGGDVAVIVYPGAEAGFDNPPPDANLPNQDPLALHPGSTTVSSHPQFSPWSENLSACTFKVRSVFDVAKRSDVTGCLRRGVHFQGDATTADQAKSDLKAALDILMRPQP